MIFNTLKIFKIAMYKYSIIFLTKIVITSCDINNVYHLNIFVDLSMQKNV